MKGCCTVVDVIVEAYCSLLRLLGLERLGFNSGLLRFQALNEQGETAAFYSSRGTVSPDDK